ncbi:MAG: PEP-CTERM sorting domain-containing protein [Verrucomicrobiaceae bacterium]|nr:MAG: PEP-CTERM sorting domain-containing protein [Verrucomicrobiaceae bacterium]
MTKLPHRGMTLFSGNSLFDKGSTPFTFPQMNNRLPTLGKSCRRSRSAFPPYRNQKLAKVRSLLVGLAVIAAGMFGVGHAQNTTWTRPAIDGPGSFEDNSNWSNGSPANATWFINNGGTAQKGSGGIFGWAADGYLGYNATESGHLRIINGGAMTPAASNLAVGFDGSGSLTINTGGSLTHRGLFIAARTGSFGSVDIDNGNLTVSDVVHVGYGGSGNLTLSGNGTITTDKADIGGFTTATGTATITDGLWQNTTAFFVGVEGNGSLEVNAQGTVTSQSLYVGHSTGGTGSVAVSGGNVTLTDTLAVGIRGTGNLTVTNGGQVNTKFFQVGLESGSSGTAILSGNASLTATDYVQVGVTAGSSGTLHLSGNGSLNTPVITVAQESGSTGVLNVSGTILSTTQINAGNGTATVNLNDGTTLKTVFLSDLTISGFSAGEFNLSGNVTFDSGPDTIYVNSSLSGTGRLIADNSSVTLTAASDYSGGTEIRGSWVDVDHANAFGTGNVTFVDGVSDSVIQGLSTTTIGSEVPNIIVGANQSAGFAAATGTTLTVAPGSFQFGNNATLTVGVFSGTNSTVLFSPDSATSLQPGTGEVMVYAGTLRAGNAQLATITSQAATTTVSTGTTLDFQDHLAGGGINNLQGNGTVNLGSNATTMLSVNSGNFSGTITGAGGLVKASSGTLVLSGYSQFTGGTTVDGGTLIVNGSLATGLGPVEVNAGGTLGGTGFVGPVTLNGGTLSPGNSPGTFFPTEILWYDGVILFELGPTPATSDFINTGKLEGFGSTYAFTFVDQGMVNGTTYDLISFDPTLAAAIPIGNFNFTNTGGFNGTFSYRSESASTSYLEFTVIPEPSTWVLLFFAGVLFAARRKRPAACRAEKQTAKTAVL